MSLVRAILCLAIAVLVGGLSWHAFTVERANDEERQRARLEALRAAVTNVDNLAMSAGYGLLPSYDPLVRSLKALRVHAQTLAADSKGTADEADLLAFRDRVEERTRQVEELKSLRSALNNSERFLRDRLVDPVRSARAGAAQTATESPVVLRLKGLLLAQRLVPDEQKNLDALHDLRPALAADESGTRLAAHLDVVLDARRRLTDLTNRLLQLNDGLASRAALLAAKQQSVLESHRQDANRGRLASLSLALLVVVAALWLPERRRG